MSTLLAVASMTGILIGFLQALLLIAVIGGLFWGVEKYISPVPPPIRVLVAIVVIIMIVIWFLEGNPSPFPTHP